MKFSRYTERRLMKQQRIRFGFTLVELLVVIAIIGILIGLLLPAVQSARESARRVMCQNNLMQMGVALHNYEMAHSVFPPGTVASKGPIQHLPNDFHHNWLIQILPFVEQRPAYAMLDHSQSIYSKANFPVRQHSFGLLHCPSSAAFSIHQSNYAAVHDGREVPIDTTNNGSFFLNSAVSLDDLFDGSSYTMFVSEKIPDSTELGWSSGTRASLRNLGSPLNSIRGNGGGGSPPGFSEFGMYGMGYGGVGYGYADEGYGGEGYAEDMESETSGEDQTDGAAGDDKTPEGMNPSDPSQWLTIGELPMIIPGSANDGTHVGGFASEHANGMNALMGDGSVRFISYTTNRVVLRKLGNRADRTLIPDGSF